ncbi:hypothetical protein BDF14DRAFT_1268984 [Spinellus fusiger]|nr:hypothetical protein BDF14DRAFT_1268984 [Spinellus fusiger]
MSTAYVSLERLTPELLLEVALLIDSSSLLQLGLTCKSLSCLLTNDLLYRRLTERDFSINYKNPTTSWNAIYTQLHKNNTLCSHLSCVSDELSDTKRTCYSVAVKTPLSCSICQKETATHLSMATSVDSQVCRACLCAPGTDAFPVQLELSSHQLECYACQKGEAHQLGGGEEEHKVKTIVDTLQREDATGNMDRRRKAEQLLYVQELRREDMSLKHYLVEKSWSRSWMLFRTREGSPLPGRITNHKLSRSHGVLDPNIRLPLDKYRPAPETHADIVSEVLWNYLEKAYGVQGKAYSEDDLQAPEYVRLRIYFDDFKNSILQYP